VATDQSILLQSTAKPPTSTMQVSLPLELLLITFAWLGPLQTHFEMLQVQSQGEIDNCRREVQNKEEWEEQAEISISEKR